MVLTHHKLAKIPCGGCKSESKHFDFLIGIIKSISQESMVGQNITYDIYIAFNVLSTAQKQTCVIYHDINRNKRCRLKAHNTKKIKIMKLGKHFNTKTCYL